jgi:NADPH:quinone reductase-like Zn-dependent oxidoreductase/acyl carrier protein
LYSTVTGSIIEGSQLTAGYWWHNIRRPVLFQQAIQGMLSAGINVLVEVGPHAVLRSYLNDCIKESGREGRVIATFKRGDDDPQRVREICDQAVIAGIPVDWGGCFPQACQYHPLPNYPWQRERYWHPQTTEATGTLDRRKVHPLLGYRLRQQELCWENQLDPHLQPALADHVVGDATVFPGTGFAELSLAAAHAWREGELIEIEDLEIRSPLILTNDTSQIIRVRIDPQDGTTTIIGKELGADSPWTTHGVWRIVQEPNPLQLRVICPPLPIRQPDFTGTSHLELTRVVGLEYGPAFQCIDHGWITGQSVLAVLQPPEMVAEEAVQMHLHPAVLDCAFQLIIQLLREQVALEEGGTYIPVRLGRIVFQAKSAVPVLARVDLLRWTEQSLSADFTLFDQEQQVIAVIKEARFRRIRLQKGATDRLQLLACHWEPMPLQETVEQQVVLSFGQVQTVFAEVARRVAISGAHRRYTQEVDPLLESLCGQWAVEAFRKLAGADQSLAREQLEQWSNQQPSLRPFVEHLLAQGLEDQVLAETAEGWRLVPDSHQQVSAQDIWNSLVADYPDSFHLIHAVGRIGMHLDEVVQGILEPAEVFPRQTSMASLICQVLGGEGKQKFGQALRQLLARNMGQLLEGFRLGVVEIGRNVPSYAADILAVIDPRCCDVTFAGTGDALAEEMPQLQERYPLLALRSIDPEEAHNASVPLAHLVVVTLDFETLEEADSALRYARACLLPGGSLVVIGMHPARWIDFLCGGQQSLWSSGPNGIPRSRQYSASFWMQQLQRLQLRDISVLELSPDTLSGPYILLAQTADTILPPVQASRQAGPRSWILLADPVGPSVRLADELAVSLQTKGDMVVVAEAGDARSLSELLHETTAHYGQLDGIVHLAGLADLAAAIDPETEVERQVMRCTLAADLLQASETSATRTTCWLVTTGVRLAMDSNGEQGTEDVPVLTSNDAALWGFGRTLMNEALDLPVRLVDLECPSATEAIAALVREFDQPDQEQEVALTARGKRFVPRLSIEPRHLREQVQAGSEEAMIRLGFGFAGKLRNLHWQVHPQAHLGEDELEVEVRATGLNFRDLMFTLGLLSDEAIENGFAGPTLGLEFSGVVRRVGTPEGPFAPGDKVVGFGPSCFADRVVTTTSAVTHLPPGISFEAAATIPCTFFTVYYALRSLAQLQPGERVLIHCAAGGVGIAAVQLAKWMGAEIFVTAGSREKRDFLRLLGVDHIFDSRSLAFAEEIMEVTGGQGVDVVLNSLAGEAVRRNFSILKPFGRFLELGKRDFYENTKIGLRPFRNNISYFGIDTDQLMQVRPELTRRLFAEVMDLFGEGVLHPLPYRTFEAEEVVDAFRYMQQARHIGKIVVTYRNGIGGATMAQPPARPSLELPEEGTYLVTGGLGGFGLRTAQWLVERGARHLVLISRSGPASEEARQALDQFEQQGVRVCARACDVTDQAALHALIAEIDTTLPPLKGIVHAATVIEDGLIHSMRREQIRKVLRPKMLGAYLLHELTRTMALDFFVLFSSATTLFGNPGQGNYVAANSGLEALAEQRRNAGLPATCVCWGAIEDVGFLARNAAIREALQGRMGGAAIQSAAALAILEDLLVTGRSGLGVMEIDWHALSRFLPSGSSPKFNELARNAGKSDREEGGADVLQRMLEELSDEELLQACIDMLRSEAGEILRMAPDKLDPNRSMYDMGLDSLMGVELVGALESRFGIRLPVLILSQNPTIAKLAEYIISQLKGGEQSNQAEENQAVLEQVRHLADQHGSDSSAVVIEQLAEDLQERGQGTNTRIIH